MITQDTTIREILNPDQAGGGSPGLEVQIDGRKERIQSFQFAATAASPGDKAWIIYGASGGGWEQTMGQSVLEIVNYEIQVQSDNVAVTLAVAEQVRLVLIDNGVIFTGGPSDEAIQVEGRGANFIASRSFSVELGQ